MKRFQLISGLLTIFLLIPYLAWASPATAPALLKIRSGQPGDQFRIVLDMTAPAPHRVIMEQNPPRMVLEIPGAVNKIGLPQILFNNPLVSALKIVDQDPAVVQIIVDLKQPVVYKVFTMDTPNRIVIDLWQFFEQKVVTEAAPGLTYTSWLRGQSDGPVWAHILEVGPQADVVLQPILSNNLVSGVETVSSMTKAAKAIAAINGSFFANNGEIIGLMKLNGKLVSSPGIPRTSLGILPDQSMLMDQVSYEGKAELPGGVSLDIDGVNRERGENELILYNGFYNGTTGTNAFGREITIRDGKVAAINNGNTVLFSDTMILSGHGRAAHALAALKVGDAVTVRQSLGTGWDKTVHAIGAGPMLMKDNSIFLTTKIEEFGSDVAGGRAPRTAVGITADKRILLVVVDGRQTNSIGMTLLELALFMQELGAVDAMNLDGGGSSTMVIQDKVVNRPSDGRERRVGNALAIVPARLAN